MRDLTGFLSPPMKMTISTQPSVADFQDDSSVPKIMEFLKGTIEKTVIRGLIKSLEVLILPKENNACNF